MRQQSVQELSPVLPVQHEPVSFGVRKERRDLVVLKYMARRLSLVMQRPDVPGMRREGQTLFYQARERRGRIHRIVIYHHRELLLNRPLFFVGFISQKRRDLSPPVLEEIERADRSMLNELSHVPDMVSYSSLELAYGDWCNLVLMSDISAKGHIKRTGTHNYAVHSLSHQYYNWIRLHNGVLLEGLDPMEMYIQKTKYYTFHPFQQRPDIRELMYEVRV